MKLTNRKSKLFMKLEAYIYMLHEDDLFFTCAKENYSAISNLVLHERQMRVSRKHRFFIRNTKRPMSPFQLLTQFVDAFPCWAIITVKNTYEKL